MRRLEKIGYEQFKNDIIDEEDLYNSYEIPKRSSKHSAGYDFSALLDYTIKPNEIVKIPTGIKASMNDDEVLLIIIRSSLGFKKNLRLCNQVGVIDSDYYNNIDNEGHIWICVQNEGKEDIILNKNDKFAQGIFTKFLTVDGEERIDNIRKGSSSTTR